MNNYYQPYGYQQPVFQPRPVQPAAVAPVQMPTPVPQNSATILFVPQVQDILSVQVPQGQKVWVMAQNEPVFAVREADAFGIVQTKYCRFETYDPQAAVQAAPAAGDYVTRAEFNELASKLQAISGGIRNEPVVQPSREEQHTDTTELQKSLSGIAVSK